MGGDIVQVYTKYVDMLIRKDFSYTVIKNWLLLEHELGHLSNDEFFVVFDYFIKVCDL